MTGFIRNLFGSKKQTPETQDAPAKPEKPAKAAKAAKLPRENTAYFLDPDSAKTFGNIEYMRTAKKIKHTFPKGKVDGAYEAEISAMSMGQGGAPQSSSLANPLFDEPSRDPNATTSATPVSARRKADSSMDMFRNMAKDMKK
jgi:hypothetical protein